MEGAVQYLGQYAIKASLVAAAYFAPCQEVIGIVFLFCDGLMADVFRSGFFSVASSCCFSMAIFQISFKNIKIFSRFFDFPFDETK